MDNYIGTKKIKAKPMTRGEYNAYRGWDVPEDEDPNDTGFLVEYVDGGKANHPDHAGYISWSPTEVFNNAYKGYGELSFGQALTLAQEGCKIARGGWDASHRFVVLMPAMNLPPYNTQAPGPKVNDRIAKHIGNDMPLRSQPYFALYTTRGTWHLGWIASQADLLATDWAVVE